MGKTTRQQRKLLLVGNWNWDIYEEALASGFRYHGWEVVPFVTKDFVPKGHMIDQLTRLRPAFFFKRLNEALVAAFRTEHPDAVLMIRPDNVFPSTICTLRAIHPSVVVMLYHNDNPFVGRVRRFAMRHYLHSLREADTTLVYRPGDVAAAEQYGARHVAVLPPYYLSGRHRPTDGGESNDVLYIGHCEDDGREEVLQFLHDGGIHVRVYGTRWESVQRRKSWLAMQNIRQVWGEEYAALLSGSRIALAFLSRRNQDVYTRRCFEIPACGALMMAPRTKEMEGFFVDGKEAVFWDSPADLLEKVRYYLAHDEERHAIAIAGRERVVRDGHDERARAEFIIDLFNSRTNRVA